MGAEIGTRRRRRLLTAKQEGKRVWGKRWVGEVFGQGRSLRLRSVDVTRKSLTFVRSVSNLTNREPEETLPSS